MTWTYQFFSPTLFFPFSLSSSKTVWSEQCSCTPLTGKCPSPSRATLLPSGSSKWREMPNLPLSSVLLCAHRLGERWRSFECTHDAICVFSCWANCFEVPWKSNFMLESYEITFMRHAFWLKLKFLYGSIRKVYLMYKSSTVMFFLVSFAVLLSWFTSTSYTSSKLVNQLQETSHLLRKLWMCFSHQRPRQTFLLLCR